ncbi:MAG: hypothetical protein R2748_17800 [Bryobacterales bacterium]
MKSLELDRGQVDARSTWVACYSSKATDGRAGAICRSLADAAGRPADLSTARRTYSFLNQLGNAEDSYRKAIALEPEKAGPHASLASVLGAQGRLGDALKEFPKPRATWASQTLNS